MSINTQNLVSDLGNCLIPVCFAVFIVLARLLFSPYFVWKELHAELERLKGKIATSHRIAEIQTDLAEFISIGQKLFYAAKTAESMQPEFGVKCQTWDDSVTNYIRQTMVKLAVVKFSHPNPKKAVDAKYTGKRKLLITKILVLEEIAEYAATFIKPPSLNHDKSASLIAPIS